ncbi:MULTISPECIES: STAS domain-containing protein [Pseudidiomarina]|jgi:anti-anti-sigma factor|uniref:Anti-anti-sigma regulatory factor n=1 Tax=Pseudidiomarina atlantica TaxID=1517416 RepID=A0A094L2M1_9GAMM|nr:STAS domain-containing protein [Pseudidiomarina atlantica]KFZ28858.1 anti-anti-sigma regulatory factor [Pseudidiomarina atlantica]
MSVIRHLSNDGKELTISIHGKFDFNLVNDFRRAYSSIGDEKPLVYIDLRETEYLDSSALGMLLNMRKALSDNVRGIHIINCRPEVKNILDISRFDKLFTIE